jgi:hypothetical protein
MVEEARSPELTARAEPQDHALLPLVRDLGRQEQMGATDTAEYRPGRMPGELCREPTCQRRADAAGGGRRAGTQAAEGDDRQRRAPREEPIDLPGSRRDADGKLNVRATGGTPVPQHQPGG